MAANFRESRSDGTVTDDPEAAHAKLETAGDRRFQLTEPAGNEFRVWSD